MKINKSVVNLAKSLPKTIRIGAHDWSIKTVDDWIKNDKDENCWGNCSINDLSLTIGNLKGVPTASILVSTFFHEVLHAVWWAQQITKRAKEEEIVYNFEQGLTQVFRDNPWFLDWIKKGLR